MCVCHCDQTGGAQFYYYCRLRNRLVSYHCSNCVFSEQLTILFLNNWTFIIKEMGCQNAKGNLYATMVSMVNLDVYQQSGRQRILMKRAMLWSVTVGSFALKFRRKYMTNWWSEIIACGWTEKWGSIQTWIESKYFLIRLTSLTNLSMAQAVENASIIMPFLCRDYERSENCEKELSYADAKNKSVIPILIEPNYKPTGWLALVISRFKYIDISHTGGIVVVTSLSV